MDFGGGAGFLCFDLAKKGFDVDYADVDGQTLNFARHFFLKNKAAVKIINLSKDKIKSNYDTIICIDVIEHLENQKEVLNLFIKHINSNGVLIITNLDFNKIDQEQYDKHPMHIPMGFGAKKYLLNNGFRETKYPWMFIKSK